MSKQTRLFAAFSFAVLGASLGVSCKKEDPNTAANANATATWGYGPNGGTAPPATTAAPTATVPPTDPTATATTPPTATTTAPPGTATATAPAPVDASVLQPLLTPLAAQHAKGAKPDGQAFAGSLQQGQSLQQNLQLVAGGARCYTVLAVGAPSVTAIKIEMLSNMPPLPPVVVAQSQTSANPSVLAGSPNCYKNLLPIPGMVLVKVTAEAGSGPVMAQVYSK
jgi:pyruvate/2-oxoglutarate dehydrogenase complex dihydrolipoamide acyltransferase (E2) component